MTRAEALAAAVSRLDAMLIEVGSIDEELREAIKDARARAYALSMRERRSGAEEVDPWDR